MHSKIILGSLLINNLSTPKNRLVSVIHTPTFHITNEILQNLLEGLSNVNSHKYEHSKNNIVNLYVNILNLRYFLHSVFHQNTNLSFSSILISFWVFFFIILNI